jgi:HD-like signal output (HDOD) protein
MPWTNIAKLTAAASPQAPTPAPAPAQLAKSAATILSLPDIYYQLLETVRNPRSSAADIAALIGHDVGLTARLLKLVNSAYYGNLRIDTVSRAISVLGTQELLNLVFSTIAVAAFKKVPTRLIDMTSFWYHSVATAVIARVLAKQCGVLHPERLFTAALLHDAGQLVIFHQLPDFAAQIVATANATEDGMHAAEQRILGYTHGDVGDALFEVWRLPDSIRDAARYHHQPARSEFSPLDTAIVHLGNCAANGIEPSRNVPSCSMLPDPSALSLTGLTELKLEEAARDAVSTISEVLALLALDTATG